MPLENKSKEMKFLLDKVFPDTLQLIKENRCPICKQPITEFRDELSIREYNISGLCQTCQDKAFEAEF